MPVHADATTQPATQPTRHVNGETWLDTNGVPINAHGGGVIFHDGTYYWYGEHRAGKQPNVRWSPTPGVHCYSSTDLMNWHDDGIVLKTITDDENSDLALGCTIERPKVIFNAKTNKFVMWLHLELRGKGYGAARAAVATSDSPTGPFKYLKSGRPNAGKWPIDFPEDHRTPLAKEDVGKAFDAVGGQRPGLVAGVYTRRDFAGGQMSRDMTLFVDSKENGGDDKAYLISSAEENYTLNLHELTDDYTDFTGKWMRIQPGGHNEAPAMIRHDGKFQLLVSGCTGWDPNAARSLVGDSIWGPYHATGNPCSGVNPANNLGPELTYGGQSTCILPMPGKPGKYIAMFDIWRPHDLITSGYVWLPMTVADGKMHIPWRDTWNTGEMTASP